MYRATFNDSNEFFDSIMMYELKDVAEIAKHHHERYDGRGYPDGLKGKAIPFGARLLALADSYDAMTSTRPYRDCLIFDKAVCEIRNNRGTQFDPQLGEKFLLHLELGNLEKNGFYSQIKYFTYE